MKQAKISEYFHNAESAADAFNARRRYEFLAQCCHRGSRILNIGVGRGGLEEILLAEGVDGSALDPSDRSIASLRERLGRGGKAMVGFSQALPIGSTSLDTLVTSEVLEHLDDSTLHATIGAVRRLLARGGRFIGTVPADENLLEMRTVCPHCGEVFHRWGHVQSFSSERLRTLLSEHFAKVTVSRNFSADPARLNWKGKLLYLVKSAAIRLGVRGSGETLFFEAVTD